MKFIQGVHLLPCPNAGTKKKGEAYQTLQTDTCYPVLKDRVGVYIGNAVGKK